MTNDQKEAPPRVKLPDDWDRKTSTIDKLLTPELLAQILGTTRRENSIRGKGNDNFNPPNAPTDTGANDGGQ